MHIAITGNIGAGKTTLAEMLAKHYGWDVLYEAVDGNPYLADFYEDMARWAFNLQIYFLNSRFAQTKYILEKQQESLETSGTSTTVIQDRTIYEDAAIFARNLHMRGDMETRDYVTYQQIFESMMSMVRPPDLMIYLRASLPKLLQQIQKRGRDFELSISEDYLASLNQLYDDFAASYAIGPLLVLDVDTLDYANRPEDFEQVLTQIQQYLPKNTY